MKCTECNRPIKPVVAVDIDGTLGDYHNQLIEFACRWLPQPYLPNTDFNDNLGLPLDVYRQMKLAYRQGGMKRTMRMFPLANRLTTFLRDVGVEIWVCTTRPYNRLDSTDPDTQEWLRRNNITYDHMLYDPNKYEQLYEIVGPERVVAVVEDLPEQAAAAARCFGHGAVLLRHNDYSNTQQDRNHYDSFRSYSDAIDMITKRLGVWHGRSTGGVWHGRSTGGGSTSGVRVPQSQHH